MAAGWTVRAGTTGYRDENMKRAIFNGKRNERQFLWKTPRFSGRKGAISSK
jgi:hypothetical protein